MKQKTTFLRCSSDVYNNTFLNDAPFNRQRSTCAYLEQCIKWGRFKNLPAKNKNKVCYTIVSQYLKMFNNENKNSIEIK